MRVIIVGCGKVGSSIALQLCAEGYDVTVIDTNSQKLRDISANYDVLALEGDGTSYKTLREAGVEEADLLIAVTDSDERNLLCCMIGRKASNAQTIARVRNPIYNDEVQFFMKAFGVSMVINPEMAAAQDMARVFRFPSAINIDTFHKGHVELLTFHLGNESILIGRPLSYIRMKLGCDVLVCVVKRGNEVVIPDGNFVIQGGDILSIVASQGQTREFFRKIGIETEGVGSVMIVGGGKMCYYLAKQLLAEGINVKIIERDVKRAEQLSDDIPEAVIINGSGTDEELLLEEGIEHVEGFTSLTGLDEQNIMLTLFAKQKSQVNVKLVTKIAKITFNDVISSLNLGSIVNPKDITADYIVQFVRSMQASMGSNIEHLYTIAGGRAEAMEIVIREKSRAVGVPLQKLKIRKNILIGKIIRGGQLLTPGGSDTMEVGDSVVLVALGDMKILNLDDILMN